MNAILTVAKKEFRDGLRNRWLLSITLIFAILSIGLSYFGSAASGSVGVTSLSTTIASLSSLAVFLIPLIALLLSYDSFVGEQEGGTLLLLLTYPVSKSQLLVGKFFGQGFIISLATIIGFGSSGLLLFWQTNDTTILLTFSIFITSAIFLGLCFIAIAFVISLANNEKSKAAGIALMTWFFFALMFDLGLLALLVSSQGSVSQSILTTLMMLNPSDIFRLINLSAIDISDVNGALAVAINANLTLSQLFSALIAWLILPLVLAAFIFKHKNL